MVKSARSTEDKLIYEHHVGRISIVGRDSMQILLIFLFVSVIVLSGTFGYYNKDVLPQSDVPSFTVSPSFMKETLKVGENIQKSIEISANTDGIYRVSSSNARIAIVDPDFSLSGGQKKTIQYTISPKKEGLFFDTISIQGSSTIELIPVVIEVINDQTGFTVDLDSEQKGASRKKGDTESVQIKILSDTALSDELKLAYTIQDKRGASLFSEKEIVRSDQTSLFKEFPLPSMNSGPHVFSVSATADSKTARSSYVFAAEGGDDVIGKQVAVCSALPFCMSTIIAIVLFIMVGVLYLYLYFSSHLYHFLSSREEFERHLKRVQKPNIQDIDMEKYSERKTKRVISKFIRDINKGKECLSLNKLSSAEKIYDRLMYNYVRLTYNQKMEIYKEINKFHTLLVKAIEAKNGKEAKAGKQEITQVRKRAKELQKKEKETQVDAPASRGFISKILHGDPEQEKKVHEQDAKELASELKELEEDIDEGIDGSQKKRSSGLFSFKTNDAESEDETLEKTSKSKKVKQKKGKKTDELAISMEEDPSKDPAEEFEQHVISVRKGKSRKFVKAHDFLIKGLDEHFEGNIEKSKKHYKKAWDIYLNLEYEEKKDLYHDLQELYQKLSK